MSRQLLVGSAAACLAALAPGSLQAGGVGVFGLGGGHSGPLLGPGLIDDEEGDETGVWADLGTGLELVIGRKDARFGGRARGSWVVVVAPGEDVAPWHEGLFSFGMTVQVLPDPGARFGLYGCLDAGVSGIALHHQERFVFDAGFGARVRLGGPAEAFGEVQYLLELRDHAWQGVRGHAGIRLHFD